MALRPRNTLSYVELLVMEALEYEPRVRSKTKLIENLIERGHSGVESTIIVERLVQESLIRFIEGEVDGLQKPSDYWNGKD